MRKAMVLIVFCSCSLALGADLPRALRECVLPEKTALGMTIEDLKDARPSAKELAVSGLFSENASVSVLVEAVWDVSPATCYHYHILGGRLRAVTKIVDGRTDLGKAEVERLHEALDRDLVKQSPEKTTRLNSDLQPVATDVELWNHEAGKISVYLVGGPYDTTVIAFDPQYLGKADFFPSDEKVRKLAPELRRAEARRKAEQLSKPDPIKEAEERKRLEVLQRKAGSTSATATSR